MKVRKCVGICSKVANSPNHWILLDVDEAVNFNAVFCCAQKDFPNSPIVAYRTAHGFHVIVFAEHNFKETAKLMLNYPIDYQWFIIGFRRGYWFLETHHFFYFKSTKNRMVFERIERNA